MAKCEIKEKEAYCGKIWAKSDKLHCRAAARMRNATSPTVAQPLKYEIRQTRRWSNVREVNPTNRAVRHRIVAAGKEPETANSDIYLAVGQQS